MNVEVLAPQHGNPQRERELAARLRIVRDLIAEACSDAGRQPDSVTLVVITKTWPSSDVRTLAALGVLDLGESRDQEAAIKVHEVSDLDLRWHFVGQLQTNKCASVASYAHLVHSVDRARLVTALDAAVEHNGRAPLRCLIQINLDAGDSGNAGRGGVQPDAARELADQISAAPGLELAGVMGVAPLVGDAPASAAFERLRTVADSVADDHPSAQIISAGMSGDFVAAINAGATHVRLGAAVLGHRPALR